MSSESLSIGVTPLPLVESGVDLHSYEKPQKLSKNKKYKADPNANGVSRGGHASNSSLSLPGSTEREVNFHVRSEHDSDEAVAEKKADGVGLDDSGDAAPARTEWNNKTEFILSVVSFAVGLGNVWRFPYLCKQNGGGAFLIPYFVSAIVCGVPLFYFELVIGQFIRKGTVGVWAHINRNLVGVGLACATTSYLIGLYYNVIIALCLYYLFWSFFAPLPWSSCEVALQHTSESSGITSRNASGYPNGSYVDDGTIRSAEEECKMVGAVNFFWYRSILGTTSSIEDFGGIKWQLLVSLVVAWLIIFLCLFRGIKSSGKVVYFTSLFPYCVLTAFFCRALTLKGAGDGIRYLFEVKIDRLSDPQVWLDAGAQVLYSFSLAVGGLIAFASYNPIKNNCKRDAIAVSITNVLTALYAATTVFAVLGYMANSMVDRCMDHNAALLNSTVEFSNFSLDERNLWQSRIDTYRVLVELRARNYSTLLTDKPNPDVRVFSNSYFYKRIVALSEMVGCNPLVVVNSASPWLPSSEFSKLVKMRHCQLSDLMPVSGRRSAWPNEALLERLAKQSRVCDLTREMDNAGEGTGLAFITFAQAITELPVSQLWSVLFFLMLLTLGIGSQFGLVEGAAACFRDMKEFVKMPEIASRTWFIYAVLSVFGCGIGTLFICGSGQYWVYVFDNYGGNFSLVSVALAETVIAIFFFKYKRFSEAVEFITGSKPELYWHVTWFVAPIVMFIVCIFTIVKRVMNEMDYLAYDPSENQILRTKTYPPFAIVIILVLALQALALIVLYPTIRYCQKRRGAARGDDAQCGVTAVRFSYSHKDGGESQVALATHSSTATSLNTVNSSARLNSFNSLNVPPRGNANGYTVNGNPLSLPPPYKPVK